VLKEHLKEFYGLTASRISQYSPGDTTKGNERQINRRPNVRFNPKATLEIIARGPPKDELGEEERRELVTKYLQFKELMNKIDEDDEEDAEGGAEGGKENPSPFKKPHAPAPPSSNHNHRRSMYKEQQQQQQQQQQQKPQNNEYISKQNADLQKLREQNEAIARQRFGSRSGSGRDRHQNSSSSGGGASSEMVLDPETGEMIAAPSGGDGSNAMSDGFLVREHNSSSSSAQNSSRIQPIRINLSKGSGSGGHRDSHSHKSKKHKKREEKQKSRKRRRIESDDEDSSGGEGEGGLNDGDFDPDYN